MNLKNIQNLNKFIPWVILSFALALVTYFIFGGARFEINSDGTDTLLWAQAALTSNGRILNPDFHYASAMPFGGHLLMVPFIPIFGISYMSHALGMILFTAVFIISGYFFGKKLGLSNIRAALMMLLVVLVVSLSPKLREIFWGHIIYYSQGIVFLFVGFILSERILTAPFVRIGPDAQKSENIRNIFRILILFLWIFLCSTGRVQTITIFGLPLIGGIMIEKILNNKLRFMEGRNFWITVLTLLLGTVIGYVCGGLLVQGINKGYADAFENFIADREWMNNARYVPHHWITLIGLELQDDTRIFSPDGFKFMMKSLLGVVITISPVILTFFYKKLNRPVKILIAMHWITAAYIIFGMIFGMIGSANWRFSPLVVTSAVMTFMLVDYLSKYAFKRRFAAVLCLALIPGLVFSSLSLTEKNFSAYKESRSYQLAKYLESYGITDGFATFWNSAIITIHSDNKVKIRPVQEIKDGFYISLYQGYEKDYYVPGPKVVILELHEYSNFKKLPQYQIPHTEHEFLGYIILYYYENFFIE